MPKGKYVLKVAPERWDVGNDEVLKEMRVGLTAPVPVSMKVIADDQIAQVLSGGLSQLLVAGKMCDQTHIK